MKYAAFFRGINVGGHNIVKMADLKTVFSDLGFSSVKTYIQSGNIVFATDIEESVLSNSISAAFERRFGFIAPVVVRSDDEIDSILKCRPFFDTDVMEAERRNPDVEHLYVYLSETYIDRDEVKKITANVESGDKIYTDKREIFLLCRESIRVSQMAAALAKLKTSLTSRNMNTMNKMRELLK